MVYDPEKHHRRSIRLRDYDYSQVGAYFVTVCTHGGVCSLGQIDDEVVKLSQAGQIILRCWRELPVRFPHVELDAFVIMPNHLHCVPVITDPPVGAGSPRPDGSPPVDRAGEPCPYQETSKRGLGQIIAYFKYQSAKQINRLRGTPGSRIWQRNYYEHIIRSQKSLDAVRRYIQANPAQWPFDSDNPANILASKRGVTLPLQEEQT